MTDRARVLTAVWTIRVSCPDLPASSHCVESFATPGHGCSTDHEGQAAWAPEIRESSKAANNKNAHPSRETRRTGDHHLYHCHNQAHFSLTVYSTFSTRTRHKP